MLSRARASPNRRRLTVGGGSSRTRGQLIVDLRAEVAFLGPRGTRVCGCMRRCGALAGEGSSLSSVEVWGSTEERERWIERKEAAGAAVKGSRNVCVRVCVSVCAA